jgi:hypothetical protein
MSDLLGTAGGVPVPVPRTRGEFGFGLRREDQRRDVLAFHCSDKILRKAT